MYEHSNIPTHQWSAMRRLYLFTMVTANGFFEGPERDISWHTVDDEFNEFAIEQLCATDLLIFGRITYELMASYWPNYVPSPEQQENDRTVARLMNSIPKLVASRTLKSSSWAGTRMMGGEIIDELKRIKQEPGEDIALFGSSHFALSLMEHGLIDEFRIMVSPTVLGSGVPLFSGHRSLLSLTLTNTRTFRNGNVLLYYTPLITNGINGSSNGQ